MGCCNAKIKSNALENSWLDVKTEKILITKKPWPSKPSNQISSIGLKKKLSQELIRPQLSLTEMINSEQSVNDFQSELDLDKFQTIKSKNVFMIDKISHQKTEASISLS